MQAALAPGSPAKKRAREFTESVVQRPPLTAVLRVARAKHDVARPRLCSDTLAAADVHNLLTRRHSCEVLFQGWIVASFTHQKAALPSVGSKLSVRRFQEDLVGVRVRRVRGSSHRPRLHRAHSNVHVVQ